LFAAALELERSVRSPPLQARTAHWWGRALHRRGDAAAAQTLLTDARDGARDLGMTDLVAPVESLLAPR